ncbi:MAG: response regulator transcription factor [Cyclobacteriaceae bacterium]|nr:response regulator transcription factor [Cyclobacteriaceae bacterium]MCH8516364.1 response regulator transcription factor [Cyclobacteriaceae bacterium]
MRDEKTRSILVVEDEQRLASLLKRGLEQQGFEVNCAFDGEMGWKLFNNAKFDLAIIDVVLPHINGLELSKKIKASTKPLPVIMLTALGTIDDKIDGFDSGADDYMVKPFDFRELEARIKVLLKRNESQQSTGSSSSQLEELVYADLSIDLARKQAYRAGQAIELTPKEYKLLCFLVENAEKVVSRQDISEKVWDTFFDTGTNFIDVYINYLRNKIDKSFEKKLIHTKKGMGFYLMEKEA